MITKNKTFCLFGKPVLNKITVKPPFEIQTQMNNEACFLYVLEGEQTSMSAIERVTAKKGESILEKCGNYLSKINIVQENTTTEFITIHFFPDTIKGIFNDEIPVFLKPTKENKILPTMTKIKASILMKKFFESLLFYFENEELIDEELLKLKIKELILLLVKTQNDKTVTSILANMFTPRIYNLKETVNAHLYSSISVDELAKLCALSRSSFIREFKNIYGQAPAAYLKNKKLKRAAELLAFSSDTVSIIAYDCGFNNLAHFSRSFVEKYQVSPSKYKLKQIDN
ncbi:MAG: helix-turn-helix transcriptional regulator [Flavobacteriales bacterium]|nr:helix-turn-helix transcriptional regulator [Flavobacteriales bacterium]